MEKKEQCTSTVIHKRSMFLPNWISDMFSIYFLRYTGWLRLKSSWYNKVTEQVVDRSFPETWCPNFLSTDSSISGWQHDFICFVPIGRPTCICALGFTGPNCGKTVCEDSCHNGGSCVVTAGNQPYCHCHSDYTGDRCQYCKWKCPPSACQQHALMFALSTTVVHTWPVSSLNFSHTPFFQVLLLLLKL